MTAMDTISNWFSYPVSASAERTVDIQANAPMWSFHGNADGEIV